MAKFLTPYDVADILRISYEQALKWIKTSGVSYHLVGKQYRVREADFEKVFAPPKEDGHFYRK